MAEKDAFSVSLWRVAFPVFFVYVRGIWEHIKNIKRF